MKASIFNASAGSGKTYRLAYKYVRDVVEEPSLYRQILAVTFTNKATEEMKRRILQQIHTLASGGNSPYMADLKRELSLSEAQIRHRASQAQSNILHDYSRFTVLTIDKFFQRLLRAFIQELGIDIGYNLEIESSTIIDQSVDALIEQSSNDESLRRWLMEYIEERVADGKRWDIREGIVALSGELFKESARESLSSEISKEELKKMIVESQHSAQQLKDELQRCGAEAMRQIREAGMSCDDFKGKSRSVAHLFRKIESGELPELTATAIRSAESIDEWQTAKSPADVKALAPSLQLVMRDIVERIDLVRSKVNTANLIRENFRSFALLSDLHRVAEQICHEQNTMLLNQTSRFVEEFVRECDAPFIYEKVGNRFSRFMIDEFQDTSRREWNNFLPLLRNAIAESQPKENSILIVGDIKQSIYRWRGGDWRILHSDAASQLGRGDTEVVNMVDNYRSLPMVVNFNNELIDRVVEVENGELNSALLSAESAGVIDVATKQELVDTIKSAYEGHRQNPKKRGESDGFVEVVTFEDEAPIMERICGAIDRGFKPCDIMILTRTNSQATLVAQMLLAFKRENTDERYRFDVMTQQALIVGYAPVSQFVIAVFRLILNHRDSLQRAIYNKFLDRDVDTPLDESELAFLREVRMFAPIEAFELIVKQYDLEANRSNIAYVQAIHEQVIDFCNNRIGDITLFLKWWEQSGQSRSLNVERSEQAIEILTLHKAKGLEKRVVIIPYCNWSMNPPSSGSQRSYVWAGGASVDGGSTPQLPITYKKDMAQSSFAPEYYREQLYSHIDSVNMLYVALTRAAESLHIMIPVTTTRSEERNATGIGKVILSSLASLSIPMEQHDEPRADSLNISYQFGVASSPVSGGEERLNPPYIMDRYRSNVAELRLRMPSKRYHEDGEYAPREVGILMHKAFERALTMDDIYKNVELMLLNSHINDLEYQQLKAEVHESLKLDRVKEWFSGEWDRVRNESEIIRGDGLSNRRPDRVMIKGRRCVVVDYKFGALRPSKYERQMAQYMELMSEMGYTDVEGYIWYIRQGEIVAVGQ